MQIDVRPEVIVRRTRREVASFMFDPRYDTRWTGGLLESRPLEPGLLRKGARVERTAQFLGRRFSYLVEVLDAEPERFVEMRAARPFELHVRYELADCDEGTRVAIRASGNGPALFRLAAPLLARMVRRSIRADLGRLKACLE